MKRARGPTMGKAGGRAVAVRAEDAALAEVAVEAGEAGISHFALTI